MTAPFGDESSFASFQTGSLFSEGITSFRPASPLFFRSLPEFRDESRARAMTVIMNLIKLLISDLRNFEQNQTYIASITRCSFSLTADAVLSSASLPTTDIIRAASITLTIVFAPAS
jgi:hypothetical protein